MGVTFCIAAGAVAWGFAEATLFFVVPDVLLTLLIARGAPIRSGCVAAMFCAVGAVAGGLTMYAWGRSDPGVFAVLDGVPAISSAMISEIKAEMTGSTWASDMFFGAFAGEPYKVFAASAGAANLAVLPFVLTSFAARLSRFLLVVLAAKALATALETCGKRAWALPALVAFWVVFYAAFWSLMPN